MIEFPSGTVTLLFSDIEGSTRLLTELGERYAGALAEHRRIVRDACARHGGVEVDTQGDAFFFAFGRALDAVAAARSAQEELSLPVRMGLHTGEPERTDEGYVGIDVHRAARVCAASHGGQVLVTESTRWLLEGDLRDLGVHRLKDVGEVRLYQLGDRSFPPPRTLSATNLPTSPTALVGRRRELADVLQLFQEGARLVTVTGPGGIGKTRFALEGAGELVEAYVDGVWFVDLSALRDPGLVLSTIASSLGAKGELQVHIGDAEMLHVLDNFEQVADAAAEIATLLAHCPNLAVLATSREALRLSGEREYPLRPLAEAPAVELFRQRACATDPSFDAPYATMARICERLDCLPLAVELAAARVKVLEPRALLERLDERLPLLTSRARDVPERQRTLRATIEWGYELLAPEERRLFERLGVFAGGFMLDAAEEICDGSLDALASLVDKSVVREQADGRFLMFETIREYALEALQRSGSADDIRRRHAGYFLALAEEAEPKLREAEQGDWLERLHREIGNIRAALDWSAENAPENQLRLAAALGEFWWIGGHVAEGLRLLEDALARASTEPSSARTQALRWASNLAGKSGDVEKSASLAEDSVAVARKIGDEKLLTQALARLGATAYDRRDYRRAKALTEEAHLRADQTGDQWQFAWTLHHLGLIALAERDYERAVDLLEQSLATWGELGTPGGIANALCDLAYAKLMGGDDRAARALFADSLRRNRDLGWDEIVVYCLVGIAGADIGLELAERAARLLGAVFAVKQTMDIARNREWYEIEIEARTATDARAQLGAERYEAAVASGRELDLNGAIEYALGFEARA